MTETLMYQQQHNPSIHIQDEEDYTFNYYYPNGLLPQNKTKKLSFSQLLQKKSSILSIGRKMNVFKKPDLQIVIPSSSQLSRSSSCSSSNTSFEDGPSTPTSHMDSLEMAVTKITDSHNPLLDYSGKGYSNFYIRLPNGNWMVRIRDANRKIIATFEIDGSMV